MYIEEKKSDKVGVIGRQQADKIAAAIETNREKGRRFLWQMGEDDSDSSIEALIEEMKGKTVK